MTAGAAAYVCMWRAAGAQVIEEQADKPANKAAGASCTCRFVVLLAFLGGADTVFLPFLATRARLTSFFRREDAPGYGLRDFRNKQ